MKTEKALKYSRTLFSVVNLIAGRLLSSRACFLFGFTSTIIPKNDYFYYIKSQLKSLTQFNVHSRTGMSYRLHQLADLGLNKYKNCPAAARPLLIKETLYI
jgi:hypothetical protein